MSFKYRKRNPGSGGARPGADRRPDITAEERWLIGRACAAYYDKLRMNHADKAWCESVIDHWLSRSNGDDRTFVQDIWALGGVTPVEFRFLHDLAADPSRYYDQDGHLSIEVGRYYKCLCALADNFRAPLRRPDPEYRLPRQLIRHTRDRVVQVIGVRLAVPTAVTRIVPGRSLQVTPGFIWSCWRDWGLRFNAQF